MMVGRTFVRLLAAALVAAAFAVSGAHAADPHWIKVAKSISAVVDQAVELGVAGKNDEAKRRVTEAYFGPFESDKMEAALRREVGSKHAAMREKQFGDLRKLLAQGATAEAKTLAAQLKSGLIEDAAQLDKAGVKPEVFEVNQ